MKYRVVIVVLVFLVGGILWYLNNDNMHMSGDEMRVMTDAEHSLTKLPDYALESVRPTEVIELKDGDVFDLEATIVQQEAGNRTIKRLAYNGQIPGPVLKVEKGAKVTVNFTNNIDMETSLHSHGLRGNWKFDGAPPLTQDPIPVGETFVYELEFPDTGVFWYHPHVREDYQQELGLYGNFIVEEDEYWSDADQEEYLIFDDILEDGEFSTEFVQYALMGRYGDTLLINDKRDYEMTVKAGNITRVFITNVANTRTFDLKFNQALTKVVGGDNGRIEKEIEVDNIIIAPSERYVIELLYDEPGTYSIFHRGEVMGKVIVEPGDTNRIADFKQMRTNPEDYSVIRDQMDFLLNREPDKRIRLDIEMKGMMGSMMNSMEGGSGGGMMGMNGMMGMDNGLEMIREHCQTMPEMTGCEEYLNDGVMPMHKHGEGGVEWEDGMPMMNQMSTDENVLWVIEDEETGKKNGEIDWSFSEGESVKISVFNDDRGMHPMQHPIHFHGQRFVVLARDGVPNDNLQWKDTVLIPSGQKIDLLVEMTNPGKWMAHCHIAEHLHSGMMFDFTVD